MSSVSAVHGRSAALVMSGVSLIEVSVGSVVALSLSVVVMGSRCNVGELLKSVFVTCVVTVVVSAYGSVSVAASRSSIRGSGLGLLMTDGFG